MEFKQILKGVLPASVIIVIIMLQNFLVLVGVPLCYAMAGRT